uniref:Acetyl-coenzyme A carboxylase carboxyl transferase subunit beta, chloroplastic n=1 Tax=Boodleopsis sp. FL1161 TaxID=2364084 RepID=A0A386AZ72_9CHLO|nr:acetyl-CoA carboxylase, carboxyl transferase subunit beta [Boodleopsis sp. FL1161]
MSILSWIERDSNIEDAGLWTQCHHCGTLLYVKHLKDDDHICSSCKSYIQMKARERVESLIDFETWRPLDESLSAIDVLEFNDYKSYLCRLEDSQSETNSQDSILTGTGLLHHIPVALGVMDFNFMGGSMGSVVGEKITRLIEHATRKGLILILVCASGGARMQEGPLSLMQMAKISAALNIYHNYAKLFHISICTSPTTGGVTASFAMLGDLIFAEPNALIGFAGRRVIQQTLQEELPENFQTAEYLLERGMLDLIIPREFLKGALYEVITCYDTLFPQNSNIISAKTFQSVDLLTEEKLLRNLNKNISLPKTISTNFKKSNLNLSVRRKIIKKLRYFLNYSHNYPENQSTEKVADFNRQIFQSFKQLYDF